jgi:hypothetical protein
MNHRRLTRSATLGLALAALAAPTAAAQQDLRSPDTRDAAEGYAPPPPSSIAAPAGSAYQDLRSPDTRDAAEGYAPSPPSAIVSSPAQDLRSPDTRDAAAGRGTFNSPDVTVVKVPEPAPASSAGGGLDWGDAGIGAGGLLGVILLAFGGTLAVMHRRQRVAGRAATTG